MARSTLMRVYLAFSVIPYQLRKKVKYIIFSATAGIFFELLSLGLLIPAIKLISDVKSYSTIPFVGPYLVGASESYGLNIAAVGLLVLLVIYLSKSLFMTYFLLYQTKFVYEVQEILSANLFNIYVNSHHKEIGVSTGTHIRNIITEIPAYTTNVLLYSLQLISELIPLIATITFLLYVDFSGTLYTAIGAAVVGFFYHTFTKKKVSVLGQGRQAAEDLRIREISHSLNSKKEILIFNLYNKCTERFKKVNSQLCNIGYSQSILQQLPRYWFEFLAIAAIIYLAFHLSATVNSGELLVTLGVFAYGAFKLLPAVNRILLSIQAIRYGMPAAILLDRELKRSNPTDTLISGEELITFHKLVVNNVSFEYSDSKSPLINNLTFEINKGEWVALIGQSGSGKTTLLEIILGLLKPSHGKVLVNGIDIQNMNIRSFYSLIGYVPQDVFIYDDSLRNNITYWDENPLNENISKSIKMSLLLDLINKSSGGVDEILSERGGNISGGQKQRIAIARALYKSPQLLIFDEATGSLDKETESELLLQLKKSKEYAGITVIAITHSQESLSLFDKIIRLDGG